MYFNYLNLIRYINYQFLSHVFEKDVNDNENDSHLQEEIKNILLFKNSY
jgi:hypothetical protein